jgi:parvulin-like peptidyl-prolyl isomerase
MREILASLWTLVSLVVLVGAAPAPAQHSKPAAVVNGEPIPISEIDDALSARTPQLLPVGQTERRRMRMQVLDALIAERLLRQFLVKNGPPIDAAEVDKQMAALADAQKSSGKTLAEFCKETHQSEAQVRLCIHNMLQYSAFARQHASDEQLKKYFQENRDYFQQVTVRVSHIVIRLPAEVTESERQEARKKLLELRAQILTGKISFAEAAKQVSQCPSATKGGDIGFITRKWMVDEAVAQAAFALKKAEISDIVQSEVGLHLLVVTDRTEPKPMEFAACVADVRDCYIEEMRGRLMTDLRKSAKIEILLP